MFFIRASIDHFSQGCLAKKIRLDSPCHDEIVTWPKRPGKKQIEFVNATSKALTFLVLPTTWSHQAIQSVAMGVEMEGLSTNLAISRAMEQAILEEATDPQVFALPALKLHGPLRAGQECPFRTCTLAKQTGFEARVALISVEKTTVSVWDYRIVGHRTRVTILPGQFSEGMFPLLGRHQFDDLAQGAMCVMKVALRAMCHGLHLPVKKAPVSTISMGASPMALIAGEEEQKQVNRSC